MVKRTGLSLAMPKGVQPRLGGISIASLINSPGPDLFALLQGFQHTRPAGHRQQLFATHVIAKDNEVAGGCFPCVVRAIYSIASRVGLFTNNNSSFAECPRLV
jgi:hypothetical protein